MAAATTIIAASTAAVSVGRGVHDMSKGRKEAKRARRDLESYERQDLRNVQTGMSVPTLGAQIEREEVMRTQAELAYTARQAGAAGAVGAVGGISDFARTSMERISSQLQESEFRMKQLAAEDESRIRSMREAREQEDIAGIGARMAYGQSLQESGASRMISTGASLAQLSMDTDWGNKRLWGEAKGMAQENFNLQE